MGEPRVRDVEPHAGRSFPTGPGTPRFRPQALGDRHCAGGAGRLTRRGGPTCCRRPRRLRLRSHAGRSRCGPRRRGEVARRAGDLHGRRGAGHRRGDLPVVHGARAIRGRRGRLVVRSALGLGVLTPPRMGGSECPPSSPEGVVLGLRQQLGRRLAPLSPPHRGGAGGGGLTGTSPWGDRGGPSCEAGRCRPQDDPRSPLPARMSVRRGRRLPAQAKTTPSPQKGDIESGPTPPVPPQRGGRLPPAPLPGVERGAAGRAMALPPTTTARLRGAFRSVPKMRSCCRAGP